MTDYFLRIKHCLCSDRIKFVLYACACMLCMFCFPKTGRKVLCIIALVTALRYTGIKPCLHAFCPTGFFPIYSPCGRTKLLQIYMIKVLHFQVLGCVKYWGPLKLRPFKFDDNDSTTKTQFYNYMPTPHPLQRLSISMQRRICLKAMHFLSSLGRISSSWLKRALKALSPVRYWAAELKFNLISFSMILVGYK